MWHLCLEQLDYFSTTMLHYLWRRSYFSATEASGWRSPSSCNLCTRCRRRYDCRHQEQTPQKESWPTEDRWKRQVKSHWVQLYQTGCNGRSLLCKETQNDCWPQLESRQDRRVKLGWEVHDVSPRKNVSPPDQPGFHPRRHSIYKWNQSFNCCRAWHSYYFEVQ